MLYASLFFSALLLIAAHIAARRHPHEVRWHFFVFSAMALFGVPLLAQVFLPTTFVLLVLLAVALRVWPRYRNRLGSFVPLSLAAFVLTHALGSYGGYRNYRAYDNMRADYPIESMAERVAEPTLGLPLTEATEKRLTGMEQMVVERTSSTRTRMLRKLHYENVHTFVNSPGFGVARVLDNPSRFYLKGRDRGEPPAFSPTSGSSDRPFSASDESDLHLLHELSVLDFVNPEGFGFVKKDRRHVAGFQPHGFSNARSEPDAWEADRIELIGLLRPEPIVYLSDRMPAMADLRATHSRALDAFESQSLAKIRLGEELVPGGPGEELRLVGAIRSGKQCVECHGGHRGDLLRGFFV